MSPCKKCEAKCCRYFALEIHTPRTKEDFENVRWYLAHRDILVYVDRRKWHLEIKNKCKYLAENNLCKIYDKRPLICREHSMKDCEHAIGDFGHTHVFKNLEEFDKYLTKRFRRKNEKRKGSQ